jgi:hypothetical protein
MVSGRKTDGTNPREKTRKQNRFVQETQPGFLSKSQWIFLDGRQKTKYCLLFSVNHCTLDDGWYNQILQAKLHKTKQMYHNFVATQHSPMVERTKDAFPKIPIFLCQPLTSVHCHAGSPVPAR